MSGQDDFSYDEAVDRIAQNYGVPRSVYQRMLGQESGDTDSAVSQKGASSAWQIMPATAKGLGIDASDPLQAAEGGLRILRDNYKRFRKSAQNEKHAWMMSVAGYHGNPANVERDLKRGGYGLPEISDGAITTRDHVLKIFDGIAGDTLDRSPLGKIQQNQNTIQPQSFLPKVENVPQVEVEIGNIVPTRYPTENGLRPIGAPPPITADWTPFPDEKSKVETAQQYLEDAERQINALPTNPNDTINTVDSNTNQPIANTPTGLIQQYQTQLQNPNLTPEQRAGIQFDLNDLIKNTATVNQPAAIILANLNSQILPPVTGAPTEQQEAADLAALADPNRQIGATDFAAPLPPPVYTKREIKPGESYDFEQSGKTEQGDEYLGMLDGKHRFRNTDGDELELDETTKTLKHVKLVLGEGEDQTKQTADQSDTGGKIRVANRKGDTYLAAPQTGKDGKIAYGLELERSAPVAATDADYKAYADYKKLPDTPELRAQMDAEIKSAESDKFGKRGEVEKILYPSDAKAPRQGQFQKVASAPPIGKVAPQISENTQTPTQTAQNYAPMGTRPEASFSPVALGRTYRQKPTVDAVIADGTAAAYGANYAEADRAYQRIKGTPLNDFTGDRDAIEKQIEASYDPKTGQVAINFQPLDRQKEIVDAFNRNGEQGIKDLIARTEVNKKEAKTGVSANAVSPTNEQLTDERLKAQARENVLGSPFILHTDDKIEQEFQRLKRFELSDKTKGIIGGLGAMSRDSSLPANLGGQNSDLAGGVVGSAIGDTADFLGGIARFGTSLGVLPETVYKHLNQIGQGAKIYENAAKSNTTAGSVLNFVGHTAVDIPKFVGMSALPGGAFVAVGVDSAAKSAGRGESLPEIGKAAAEGVINQALFHAAPRIGKLAEQGLLKAVLPAAEYEAIASGISAGHPGDILIAKAVNGAYQIGTVGIGTFTAGKAFGKSNEDAFNNSILMTLMHTAMQGEKIGKISDLAGKVFRMSRGGTVADVTINHQGKVLRLKSQLPKEAVDAEFNLDKTIDVLPDENGVYRAANDTRKDGTYRAKGEQGNQPARTSRADDFDANQPGNVPNNKPVSAEETVSNNGARLGEGIAPRELEAQNPQRIDAPHPEAVREVAKSTHAQKISEILADGQAHSIESLQKQTRFSRENVETASMSLYGARRVEMMPDGSIRRIETPSAEIEKPRTIAERAAEKYQPQGEPIQLNESTLPVESAEVAKAPGKVDNMSTNDNSQKIAKSETANLPEQIAAPENLTATAYENLPQQKAQEVALEKPKAQVIYAERPNVAEKLNVFTERGTKAAIEPKVVESSDLLTSLDEGYPQEFQPRDRSRAASKAQISEIANRLNFEFLGDSPKASDGRPLAVAVKMPDDTIKYAIISGNGRANGIIESYKLDNEGSRKYAEFARSKAERSNHKQPVYLGILDPNEIKDLPEFAKESNESTTAQMSATEQAKSDAERLDADVLNLFVPSDDGGIHTASNRDFTRAFMERAVSTGEQGRLVDADGKLNQDGITRVRNAVFASAFGESEAGLSAITRMSESTDNNVKNITNGLLAKAGALATLKQAAKTGTRYKDFDVASDFAKAMEKYAGLKDAGTSVDEYIKQGNLFGAETTPFQTRVMQVFDTHRRSSKAIRGIIRPLAKVA